ncbi:hypothetical protein KP509_10G028900 [Ceratopteris richardii]|nr:hypothetical protein KP509_10G028900 [Ceratopteris richardii]
MMSEEGLPWDSIILDCLQEGKVQQAFLLYDLAQHVSSVPIRKHTYKGLLKSCIILKDPHKGFGLHAEIVRMNHLEGDTSIGNMLVDFYIKNGMLVVAHEVFHNLSVRDVVSWNILISGLVENGLAEESIKLCEQMEMEKIHPDAVTLASCLKASADLRAVSMGRSIHVEVERKGLLKENVVLGTTLVDMYLKCGFLDIAQEIINGLTVRDAILWTSLISAYANAGWADKALDCIESLKSESVLPDDIAYICILKACGNIQAINKGREIHSDIQKRGLLNRNCQLGNALVDMYCKCGLLDAAERVFHSLPFKDVVSWNTLITGFLKHGDAEDSMKYFDKMRLIGICPSSVTLISSLQACGNIKAGKKGQEIHIHSIQCGLLEQDAILGTVLVDMYGKCGMLAEAQHVFDDLPDQSVFAWNALISGYVNHGLNEKALDCLSKMQLDNIDPDNATFVLALKACGCLGDIERGELIRTEMRSRGNLEEDLAIGTAFVDMYSKCGDLTKAQELFDKLPVRNVINWTALVAGYADHDYGHEALKCLSQMQLEGVNPNAITLLSCLKAYLSIGREEEANKVIDNIAEECSVQEDLFIGNFVVDAYSKYGFFAKAQEVFDQLLVRDVVSWNSLIAGYVNHDYDEDALECYNIMQLEGIKPDGVTYLCSLKACGKVGAIDLGHDFHMEIERRGLVDKDMMLGTALVDMYAKCGLLIKAQEVFDKLQFQNITSWNALISGFAQLGQSDKVFLSTNKMLRDGLKPDCVTLLILLSSCNLTGMFDTSQTCFEAMANEYGIIPILEHYSCIIDILARKGELQKAEIMVQKIPMHPNGVIWHALLSACRRWGNTRLEKQVFESAIHLNNNDGAAYALKLQQV